MKCGVKIAEENEKIENLNVIMIPSLVDSQPDSEVKVTAARKGVMKTESEARIKLEYSKNYISDHEEYVEKVYKKNEAMLLVKRMKREKEMIAIKDVFVTAMADASAIIVRKLQSELERGKYVTLARALGGIIKVRATGEMIEDSLINNSLTGVREVLYDKYIKNTIVSVLGIMVNAWTRRITPREADKKPWELLDECMESKKDVGYDHQGCLIHFHSNYGFTRGLRVPQDFIRQTH
jgi:hypothetical protein